MTDRPKLRHAYGPAGDTPALLDRIAAEPAPGHWTGLWSALCHQGSVHSAGVSTMPLWPMAGTKSPPR
ncbi:hypothetical protein [Streptomyces nitrosporeus]|uniref:hypothetical protein n=1 Tax=Streptomyces nitrosporeus TaxID=28894 RepID=UPI003327F28A